MCVCVCVCIESARVVGCCFIEFFVSLATTVRNEIELCAVEYINEHVQLDGKNLVLWLPALFEWFKKDFGSEADILTCVVSCDVFCKLFQ